jgi:hypothetical protein
VAKGLRYRNSAARNRALPHRLRYYNERRPHSSLGGRAPISRAHNVSGQDISIDHEEQERLRFSPDDIVKLPIHRAINLWVAHGIPRAGFLAATLPMEDLH